MDRIKLLIDGHKLVFRIVVVALIAITIFVLGLRGGKDYVTNIYTELVGVLLSTGVTVVIVDRLYEQRDRVRLKRRLVREAGSRANVIAISAIEELREQKWLTGEDGLLQGEKLYLANLKRAKLFHANLIECDLSNAKLQKADLRHAKMQDAVLRFAKLKRAYLDHAVLDGGELSGADLRRARLDHASFQASNRNRTHLIEARMDKAFLHDAKLHDAVLIRAELPRAMLRYAILHRADMSSTNLKGADLRNAQMQGALLYGAKLQGAYLEGADVTDVRMYSENTFPNMTPEDAALPDGTPYTDDLDVKDLDRFTNRDNDDFERTLEEVKKQRQKLGIED